MILRWLVTNLVRQAAERHVREAMTGVVRDTFAQTGQASEGQPSIAGASAAGASAAGEEILPADIAFVFALGIESGGLVDRLTHPASVRRKSYVEHAGELSGQRVVVADTGVGEKRAARAVAEIIEVRRPNWIVSAGFAGALTEDLLRGHMLMADSVADESGARLAVGLNLAPEPAVKGLHVGRLLTVDRLVRSRKERRRLAAEHEAVACDMESSAVADACRRLKTRFLSVRIISDGLDDELPPEIERLLKQKSMAGKAGAALNALVNRPAVAKDLWRLREDATKASDRLAKFLLGVAGQLSAVDSR